MKKFAVLLFILITLFCGAVSASSASTLVIPDGTKVIEEEAFYGDTSIEEVVLPEGIEEIGARAFATSTINCINLPASLDYIAIDIFVNCSSIYARMREWM